MQGFVFFGLFFASSLAVPTSNHVVHEKRDSPLSHTRERLDPDAIIPIRIALRQSNLHIGPDRLMDVSHPSSPNYGKHLSAEEVHDLFAPTEASVNAVKDWLLSSGLEESDILHYENKGWLALDIPTSLAEDLLKTEYYEYEKSGSYRIGCDAYSMPAHVSEYVDFVKPGITLSAPVRKRTAKREPEGWPGRPGRPGPPWHRPPNPWPHWQPPPAAHGLPPELRNCGVNITPPCIKALYNIPNAHLKQPVNVMGLFERLDAFSQRDLDLFYSHFAPNIPQGTAPQVNSVDGGNAPVKASNPFNAGESDLDIDLAYSLIYPQNVVVYQVDDLPNILGETGATGLFNSFLDAVDGSYCNYTAFGITGDSPIDPDYPDKYKGGYKGPRQCGKYELTRVISVSYGTAEHDLPRRYQLRQCSEIMKLSLQGHSFFVASGDFGVAGYPGEDHNKFGCLSGNGQKGTIYNPDSFSSCPWWTSVGATQLYPDQTVNDPESAMQVNLTAFYLAEGHSGPPPTVPFELFATSGGFSNYHKPPAYQQRAVSEYLANHNTLPYYIANADGTNIGENGGVYNRAGRGYPDVSANGAFLLTYVHKTIMTVFGTSLASPIFASVITLINEERTAVGKGPVGFINPVLYEHPYVLNDITNGSNPNCGSSGFQASKGWDPVTGLGTPNYPKMLELFMSLP